MINVASDLESTSLQNLAHAIYGYFSAVKMNVLLKIVDICNIFAKTLGPELQSFLKLRPP